MDEYHEYRPSYAEVFSDISKMGRVVGYCFIIQQSCRNDVVKTGRFVDELTTNSAEIAAMAMAVDLIDSVPLVLAWTDIHDLPAMFDRDDAISYQSKCQPQIEYLRQAAAKHGKVEVKIVDRSHVVYRRCHRLARAAAAHKTKTGQL